MEVFPATLGTRERLITYGVGYGVGFGVPLTLGISFAIGFGQPGLMLFPVPFLIAFGAPYFFRPTGFGISAREISILRPVGPKRIPLESVQTVVCPAGRPERSSFGVARVEGLHGSFGTYWNREWGKYRVYVTNHDRKVELRLRDHSRVILSPDDPPAFVEAVGRAAAASGLPVSIERS